LASKVYENGLKELQTMKDQLDGDHGDIVDENTALVIFKNVFPLCDLIDNRF